VNLSELFPHVVEIPPPDEPWEDSVVPTHGGVLALSDDNERPIQVLSTQNVRRAARFRLRQDHETINRRRADIRVVARRLWWTPAYSQFESTWVYWRVARRLWPDDYLKQLGFGQAWFAAVNFEARFPRWRAQGYVFKQGDREVGPFDTQRRCAEFIALLEELFDLCRYYEILVQAPLGQACAYHEMGKCPAPCDGSISLDDYHRIMWAAAEFAQGEKEPFLSALEADMRQASERRDFVRAARLKELLERSRQTLQRSRPITSTPREFRFLIVQRGETRSRVKPFFVDRGRIEAGESVKVSSVAEAVGGWIERMHREITGDLDDGDERSEAIWLVVHFLAKGRRAAGLFLPASDLVTPDKLCDLVQRTFGPVAKKGAPDNAG